MGEPNEFHPWLEGFGYDTSVPVFLERYLLPLAVAVTVLIVFTNPMNFDWTQRITGGLAILFAAGFVAQTAHKLNSPSSSPGPGTPTAHKEENASRVPLEKPTLRNPGLSFDTQMVLPDGRTIISCGIEDLQLAFQRNTIDQYNRLLGGKWIKTSGKIQDNLGNGIIVFQTQNSPSIFLKFGRAWEEQLSVLQRGAGVTIRGKMAPAEPGSIMLVECELL